MNMNITQRNVILLLLAPLYFISFDTNIHWNDCKTCS